MLLSRVVVGGGSVVVVGVVAMFKRFCCAARVRAPIIVYMYAGLYVHESGVHAIRVCCTIIIMFAGVKTTPPKPIQRKKRRRAGWVFVI